MNEKPSSTAISPEASQAAGSSAAPSKPVSGYQDVTPPAAPNLLAAVRPSKSTPAACPRYMDLNVT